MNRKKELLKSWEDTLPGVIYRVDISEGGIGKPVLVNKKIKELCGYSALEILSGKIHWLDLVIEEDRAFVLKSIKPKPEGELILFEYRIRHRNGQVKIWLNRAINIWVAGKPRWREGIILDITGEKKHRQELAAQGQLLTSVAQIAKIGGWEIDTAKMTIHWSDEIYRIREVEKSSEPTIEEALRDYAEEDRLTIQGAIRKGIENGVPWDLELPITTAKGNNKWVRDVGIPEMKDGKCITLRGVLQDITEKKQAEITLLEKEQSLDRALAGADLGTWDWNFMTQVATYNERWAQMLGYTLEELRENQLTWEKLLNPDDRPAVMDARRKYLKGELEYLEIEYRLHHKFGHWIWILDRGKVVQRGSHGEALRASGTHLDITQRKSIEIQNLKLRQELEEFKEAVSASSIVSVADLKGIIVYANDKFEEISQYKLNELIGRSHNIINSSHHPKFFWKDMWKTVSHGGIWRAEVKNKRKDGTYYWVDTFIMPLRDTNNKVIRYLSIRNDITEKKENEVKLRYALEKAEESDRLKSAFLANMSHEIRTPMNAIMGLTELLERPNFSEEKKHEFAKLIQSRGRDLLNLVNDILDISRIEAGQVSSVKVIGNIGELFEQLLLAFHVQSFHLNDKNIVIRAVNDLKPEDDLVVADFIRLNQILTNLLTNACKFTTNGSIEFGCRFLSNETLLFSVKDTGMGIPAEQVETIFKPFRQASDAIHQRYGGSGLGLAICKGLVEVMGGKIWVESKEGVGSRFYFTIPYVRAMNHTLLQALKPRYNWSDKTILLVEDDLMSARYLMELLAPTEIEVVHFITGLEAIARLDKINVDMAVLDLGLPDMSGFHVAKIIKEKFEQLPLIAVTAYTDAETKLKCEEAGFSFYLTKPVTKGKLLTAIEQILK